MVEFSPDSRPWSLTLRRPVRGRRRPRHSRPIEEGSEEFVGRCRSPNNSNYSKTNQTKIRTHKRDLTTKTSRPTQPHPQTYDDKRQKISGRSGGYPNDVVLKNGHEVGSYVWRLSMVHLSCGRVSHDKQLYKRRVPRVEKQGVTRKSTKERKN